MLIRNNLDWRISLCLYPKSEFYTLKDYLWNIGTQEAYKECNQRFVYFKQMEGMQRARAGLSLRKTEPPRYHFGNSKN